MPVVFWVQRTREERGVKVKSVLTIHTQKAHAWRWCQTSSEKVFTARADQSDRHGNHTAGEGLGDLRGKRAVFSSPSPLLAVAFDASAGRCSTHRPPQHPTLVRHRRHMHSPPTYSRATTLTRTNNPHIQARGIARACKLARAHCGQHGSRNSPHLRGNPSSTRMHARSTTCNVQPFVLRSLLALESQDHQSRGKDEQREGGCWQVVGSLLRSHRSVLDHHGLRARQI